MIPFIVSAFSSEKRFKAIKVKNGYKRTPFFVLFCFFREKKMPRYLGGLYQARATKQANILHLDQKAAKCTTCKPVCGKF